MPARGHHTSYDAIVTHRCERALVTLLGDLGPWREHIYLVGGLAPRYLVGSLPEGAAPHVGTTDLDLVIGMALGEEPPAAYRTLHTNLRRSGFRQVRPSFAWQRRVDETTVTVEFLGESDDVEPGAIFSPGRGTGSRLSALNVRGALLARDDYVEVDLEGERLDRGGWSRVTVRVANVLPYVVLKALAFQDRHENKDAYDLVFTLLHAHEGPHVAGQRASMSPVKPRGDTVAALSLLADRFADATQDGPNAYANFVATPEDEEEKARFRQQAVATVRAFLDGFSGVRESP